MGINVGKSYDPSAVQFLGAIQNRDYTIGKAINDLVVDLKTYSIWDKMKAVYPLVGGTVESHKFNLKDPRDADNAFRLTFSGSWDHSNTGAKPDGISAYADTKLQSNLFFNISTGQHLAVYNSTTSTGITIGGGSGNITDNSFIWKSSTQFRIGNDGTINNEVGFALAMYYNGSIVSYNNASQTFKSVASFNGFGNRTVVLGGYNYNTIIFFDTSECRFTSIGDGLTDTEAANFYTVVQRFQTTLGRQV